MTEKRRQQLKDFFNLYAERFNSALRGEGADIEGTAAAFADCLIAASPQGVNCGSDNEDFRKAMSQGYAFYRIIGVTAMDILSAESTLLDDLHEMTRILWRFRYTRKDLAEGSVDFENIYFTQSKNNETKIFAYITGDEQAALREKSLIRII